MMIIVCTKDPNIVAWTQDTTQSGSPLWTRIFVLDGSFDQRQANRAFAAALGLLGKNEPLCLSAHGNDYEIGDAGSSVGDWSWSRADVASLLATSAPQGYAGPILIRACANTVSNFSAGLAVALQNIPALNGAWVYGYNLAVEITRQYPDPSKLATQKDLQPTQVVYSAKRTGTMTSKAVSFRHHYSDPASSALIEEAHSYFDSLDLAQSGPLDPTIQDSNGLVSYIVVSSNPPPEEIKALYDQIAPIMEGLTNVVTSAVIIKAGTDDAKKHDPAIWQEPMQQMCKAFCGGFAMEQQNYNKTIRGVEVATSFLNILIEAAVSQGAALASFVKFLQSQGESMRFEAGSEGDKYLYASVSIIHEIFQAADGRWIYVPKFKCYYTKFTRETFKITSACGSYNSFKFAFDLQIFTGVFMVESWKNFPSFREKVKGFIEKFQKLNIDDSENYFDGIFESNDG
jgi:hypothetical protein